MRTHSMLSMNFEEAAEKVQSSVWFQSSTMGVHRGKGYRSTGFFGLQAGVKLTPSAFYETLGRGILALKATGPDCLLAADFGDYRAKSKEEIAYLLAIQYHLEASDYMDLTPRQFWNRHGKELMFHPDLKSVAGGQRMETLGYLETEFYSHCEQITLETLMDLHIDFCQALSDKLEAGKEERD